MNTDIIKEQLNIRDVLQAYNIDLKGRSGCCPIHKGTNPKQFNIDEQANTVTCWGDCNKTWDVYGFIQAIEGCTFPRAKEIAAGMVGVYVSRHATYSTKSRSKPKTKRLSKPVNLNLIQARRSYVWQCCQAMPNSPGENYLSGRGLRVEIMRRFRLGWDADRQAVVYPTIVGGQLQRFTGKRIKQGDKLTHKLMSKQDTSRLFNEDSLQQAIAAGQAKETFVILCEGELNVLSVEQERQDLPLIAVGVGAKSWGRNTTNLLLLHQFKGVLQNFDDDADKDATWWIKRLNLTSEKCQRFRWGKGLDANDLLQHHGGGAIFERLGQAIELPRSHDVQPPDEGPTILAYRVGRSGPSSDQSRVVPRQSGQEQCGAGCLQPSDRRIARYWSVT